MNCLNLMKIKGWFEWDFAQTPPLGNYFKLEMRLLPGAFAIDFSLQPWLIFFKYA